MPALIAQHFGSIEANFEVRLTQHAGHAVELARTAAADGFEVVAAVGGDGTVNEVGGGCWVPKPRWASSHRARATGWPAT